MSNIDVISIPPIISDEKNKLLEMEQLSKKLYDPHIMSDIETYEKTISQLDKLIKQYELPYSKNMTRKYKKIITRYEIKKNMLLEMEQTYNKLQDLNNFVNIETHKKLASHLDELLKKYNLLYQKSPDTEKYLNIIQKYESYKKDLPETFEWYIQIPIISLETLQSNLKDIEPFSSYESKIFKGTYKEIKCYVKYFGFPQKKIDSLMGLLYEQKIYRYINKMFNIHSLGEYLIKPLDYFRIKSVDLSIFLQKYLTGDELSNYLPYTSDGYYYVIITEDIEGMSLYEWLEKITDDYLNDSVATKNKDETNEIYYEIIIDIMFELFYGIYVLNLIGIAHNNLRCENIIVKELSEPIKRTYTIGISKYERETYFIVKLYEFDLSYLDDYTNLSSKFAEQFGLRDTPKKPYIDVWQICVNILFYLSIFNEKRNKSNLSLLVPIFDDIFEKVVLDHDYHLMDLKDRILDESKDLDHDITFAFCNNPEQISKEKENTICENVENAKIFDMNDVMRRFIQQYKKYLHIKYVIQSGGYYQKYMKYKMKYSKLKKQH